MKTTTNIAIAALAIFGLAAVTSTDAAAFPRISTSRVVGIFHSTPAKPAAIKFSNYRRIVGLYQTKPSPFKLRPSNIIKIVGAPAPAHPGSIKLKPSDIIKIIGKVTPTTPTTPTTPATPTTPTKPGPSGMPGIPGPGPGPVVVMPGSGSVYGPPVVVATGPRMVIPATQVVVPRATTMPVSAPEVCERRIDDTCYFATRQFMTPRGQVSLCVKVCDQPQPEVQTQP